MTLNERPFLIKGSIPILIAAMAAFSVIAYFVATNEFLPFDTALRERIYSFRSGPLTLIFTAITYAANWQTVSLLCIAALLIPRARLKFGLPITCSAICSTIAYKVMKTIFARPRPDLSVRLITEHGYSFPSGHSMTSLVFYGVLIWLCRRAIKNRTASNLVTVLLSILIFSIGFSRIYLGVHFPTDVLGGWALGTALLVVLVNVFTQLRKYILRG